ncbi:MAG: septum formation protein Maf [Bacteroidales bacterium]|nr:septum formation protein Maf [Bacteroidales bacterium]
MVLKNLEKYDIILASASPRRHELMQQLGIDFKVEVRPVKEDYPPTMKGTDIAIHLSASKANAFERAFFTEKTMIITADTIVCLEGTVLGKPAGREDAINTLQQLSGKKHQVITGVNIRTFNKEVNFSVSTDVYFKSLQVDEILYYVDRYKPYDKAGAYGIQEWIGYIGIEKIDGSFYNVMGLPVLKLYEELRKF